MVSQTKSNTKVENQHIFRVEVWRQAQSEGLLKSSRRLYFMQGELSLDDVVYLCTEILVDPVIETYLAYEVVENAPVVESDHNIDVTLLPGVTDPAAENLLRAGHVLGIHGLQRVATGQRYMFNGNINGEELEHLALDQFANPVIQRYSINEPITPPFVAVQTENDLVETISLKDVDDEQLMVINKERRLSLDLNEMRTIREYYGEVNREPTDAELEMLAQTWSEHCVHKTFKAKIDYEGPDGKQTIDGILKTYLRSATQQINKPWVRSAFVDNAGIVRFDDQWDLAFKAETHNRPSAIEPFGGANTGVGGVVRDVLGVSARPIANTDILCFGPPDLPDESLPVGVLHPRRIAEGVIAGVEDYGNKMGIPTVNGAIIYHKGYTSNPLVFCGCVGILPHGAHPSDVQAGDFIVVIGGRTGRDGLRGATFSSMEMDTTTSTVSGGAVQIGHPIHEKQVQEVVLRARDEKLYSAITDCGAGGLSSAVGEMGSNIGATVQLERVPLKYPGLQPWEIWLSEAQERMVLAVHPDKWQRLQQLCDGQDVEAVAIGTFEPTGRIIIYYDDNLVGDLAMDFLHDGIPQRHMQAIWQPPPQLKGNTAPLNEDLTDTLLRLLAMPTIRSKEDVIRRYDHEVQGGTALKPLVGINQSGPADATVLVPHDVQLAESTRGFALSNGVCPTYTELDPYAMAWSAIDEALRNLVAVGADPDQVSILDNFSWGNTSLPDRLGSLVRCAQGCYDSAIAYGTPFISGKDSLNNEYLGEDGERHAIPGTLVISGLGIVPDVNKTVTMDLKRAGNLLFVIGETRDELGGSHYNLLHGIEGGIIPQPNTAGLTTFRVLHQAIQAGLIQSCHDMSEGGIGVALAEMCIAGGLGAEIELGLLPKSDELLRDYELLYAESLTRFIIEVRPQDVDALENLFADIPIAEIGAVDYTGRFSIIGREQDIHIDIQELEWAWRGIEQIVPIEPEIKVDDQSRFLKDDFMERTVIIPNISTRVGQPRVLILHANGTNRDRDAYLACQLAGGEPEIVHVNQLIAGERHLLDYHMLVVPGGFSYGDDLGAGVLWAMDLRHRLNEGLKQFADEGRPILGICNGFQTLVKAGLLPDADWSLDTLNQARPVTLTYNQLGKFECRWVYLQPVSNSPCIFTQDLTEPIYCPVAHGEGRVMARDEFILERLKADGLAPLIYVDEQGNPAGYPYNPNGSTYNIAGLCNPTGNVFGLMPHPEDHIFAWQHPRFHRGARGMDGLRLFKNGMKFA